MSGMLGRCPLSQNIFPIRCSKIFVSFENTNDKGILHKLLLNSNSHTQSLSGFYEVLTMYQALCKTDGYQNKDK